MAKWEREQDLTCSCGAQYHLEGQKVPWRDKDDARCDECAAVLHEWNGGRMYRLVPKSAAKKKS